MCQVPISTIAAVLEAEGPIVEDIMDCWDLKKWRKRLGYNQVEAAARLGVQRGALQNWEQEVRPIPLTVELACKELERESQQRADVGDVLLISTDGPIVQSSDEIYHVPLLRCEVHVNSNTAIEAVRGLRSDATLTSSLILSKDGTVIWDAHEVIKECRRRDARGNIDEGGSAAVHARRGRRP